MQACVIADAELWVRSELLICFNPTNITPSHLQGKSAIWALSEDGLGAIYSFHECLGQKSQAQQLSGVGAADEP